ncbi:MAG: carboxypeptidase regulatory-like domain-containing protein [Cyanothece sp. SIO1E1]|nr:carboxypeptidase regulatory-like domain-containing protein [Cyanothece sp. SIO1E1]
MRGKQVVLFGFLAALILPTKAFAHGVKVDYQITQAIEITASYDMGEPIAGAQVVVYAPNNSAEPWLTGTANDAGKFTFTPDITQSGNWQVKVRQAGHGDIVSIPVNQNQLSNLQAASAGNDFTPWQRGAIGAVVIWGFVGTALFFSSRQ